MKTFKHIGLVLVGLVALMFLAGDTLCAARGGGGGGGGGSRGGGGGYSGGGGGYRGVGGGGYSSSYSRPSYSSGGSSIRYSSSPSYSRPSTPTYSRPASPSYFSQGSTARPSTPTARPTNPVVSRSSVPSYRPANYGSITNGGNIQHGSITTPGGTTIGGARGPNGGAAVGVKGGAGGREAAKVWTPSGASVAGARGPGGYSAAAVRGPGGYGVGGARGPYGRHVVTTLPAGAARYGWRGHNYWHYGYGWYWPSWVGDTVYYTSVYPPIDYYYPTLPDNTTTIVYNNNTYYQDPDGVYYAAAEQDGQQGYKVVAALDDSGGAAATTTADATTAAAATAPADTASAGTPPGLGDNPFPVLKHMCEYLSKQSKLNSVIRATADEVQDSGEKIQLTKWYTVNVNRPNQMSVDLMGDEVSKSFIYDGKTLAVLDRNQNLYSIVAMPGSVDGMLDSLAQDYGMAMPLADLIYTNPYERMAAKVTGGQDLGQELLDGNFPCYHLAFTQDNVDWEVWISTGDKPLPRKITIDYKQIASRPRYSATIVSWNEAPTFDAQQFVFQPPTGATMIPFTPANTASNLGAPDNAGQPAAAQ